MGLISYPSQMYNEEVPAPSLRCMMGFWFAIYFHIIGNPKPEQPFICRLMMLPVFAIVFFIVSVKTLITISEMWQELISQFTCRLFFLSELLCSALTSLLLLCVCASSTQTLQGVFRDVRLYQEWSLLRGPQDLSNVCNSDQETKLHRASEVDLPLNEVVLRIISLTSWERR